MKKRAIKKMALWTTSVFLLLVAVLCIHIYIVTRPKAPDANTIVMARIDIKQPITKADADKITEWMYQQNGIDHVVCNPSMDNIVFTFFPIKANANDITAQLKTAFNLQNAKRYLPTEAEMQSGCPVASTSYTYKVYNFIKKTF